MLSCIINAQTTTNITTTIDAGNSVPGSILNVSSSNFANGKAKISTIKPEKLVTQVINTQGAPQRIPNNDEPAMIYDRLNSIFYLYKSPYWYRQGEIVRNNIPSDSIYSVAGQTIVIKFTDCRLYHTTTQSFWAWTGEAWRNERSINVDSLLAANNRWLGKNTFTDSLTADKGIKTGGLIDTKGLNTEGGVNTAASFINGVQASKVEVITSNITLNGQSNVLLVRPGASDINITLPVASTANKGWKYTLKKDNTAPFMVNIRNSNNTLLKSIYSKDVSLIVECDGVDWLAY